MLLVACARPQTQPQTAPDAQTLIDQAIAAHGGAHYTQTRLAFRFRGVTYTARRDGGAYSYSHTWAQGDSVITDVLDNAGFRRSIDGQPVTVPDSMATKYSASVNSVLYFALLPYGLNDPAVRKTYLGEVVLRDTAYHKVQVTFAQEGGGEDYDDVYVYWIRADSFYVDYLAYAFVEDSGGLRFRKAYHPHTVGGIRFQNYENYAAGLRDYAVGALDSAYLAGALRPLSRVELDSIVVQPSAR
ncbi:MAG: hypothetical protein OHK0039_09960 [Bacteroidia bacterium]